MWLRQWRGLSRGAEGRFAVEMDENTRIRARRGRDAPVVRSRERSRRVCATQRGSQRRESRGKGKEIAFNSRTISVHSHYVFSTTLLGGPADSLDISRGRCNLQQRRLSEFATRQRNLFLAQYVISTPLRECDGRNRVNLARNLRVNGIATDRESHSFRSTSFLRLSTACDDGVFEYTAAHATAEP